MATSVQSYRNLKIWRKGIELVKSVYARVAELPRREQYALADQVRRSAVLTPSKIAEGQARQHAGEFRQSLHMALGSGAEVDTQAVIALELGHVTQEKAVLISQPIVELRRMIFGLLVHLPAN